VQYQVVALTQDNYNVKLASLLADGLPQSHSGDFIPIAVTDEFEVWFVHALLYDY
jgi:hypothetical protein